MELELEHEQEQEQEQEQKQAAPKQSTELRHRQTRERLLPRLVLPCYTLRIPQSLPPDRSERGVGKTGKVPQQMPAAGPLHGVVTNNAHIAHRNTGTFGCRSSSTIHNKTMASS